MVTEEEIRERFAYHKPNAYAAKLHEKVNAATLELALMFAQHLPMSRGTSLALTKLEEARMWANQAIATDGAQGGL